MAIFLMVSAAGYFVVGELKSRVCILVSVETEEDQGRSEGWDDELVFCVLLCLERKNTLNRNRMQIDLN